MKTHLNLFVILCFVFGFSSTAFSKEVITGIYGLWAADNIELSLQELGRSNFKLVSGLENKKYLDMANKYGLKCLVGFRSGLTKEITDNEAKWNDYLEALKRYVTELKDNAGVYAWYLVDEPDLRQIPLEKIKKLSETVRSIDKAHPMYTVLYSDSASYKKYYEYFDIIGIEPYLKANDTDINVVRSKIAKIQNDFSKMKLNKKVFVVLGAFDLRPRKVSSVSQLRKPTPLEFKQMVIQCMKANVDGILVYTLAFKDDKKFLDWNLINDDFALWNAVKILPKQVAH